MALATTNYGSQSRSAYTFSAEYMTLSYFTNATTDGVKFGKLKQNKTKILGTSSWLQADHEYDEFGRSRKITHGNHIYNVNNADSTVMAYNYADQVMTTKRSHRSASATRQTIDLRYIYDKMGRQTDEFITLNGGSEVKISNQKYTFKDQIAEKNIGGITSPMNTYLQSIDYTYNEMGWLRQINQSSLSTPSLTFPNNTCSPSFPAPTNAGIAADPDVHDLFFQELRYDSVFTTTSGGFSGMPTNLQKNGNIAQTAWRIKGRDMQAYNYTYDYLDRMLNSTYYNVAGTTATASNRYNENLTYDEKGNINTLNRRGYANTGVNTCTYDIIDNLNYTYNSEKSRLTSISDVANATYRPYGFSPGSGGVGYGYDANGNLKSDTYKGITNINYNHLNLPTIIQWGSSKSIEFTYDAGGNKLRKIVKTGVNTNAVKDYVAGIEYDTIPGSRIIESIYHSEGRYYNHTGTVTPTWRLEYSLRDHLGNTRISFSDLNSDGKIDVPSEILQENQYYAFGLEHEGNWKMTNIAEDMPYTYNGKEWNSEHNLKLYDYGARWYDPVVGRFTAVDPLADAQPAWNPYRYGLNNPLRFTDPTGMAEEDQNSAEAGYERLRQNKQRTYGALAGEYRDSGMGEFGEETDSQLNESSGASSDGNQGCGGPGEPPCENEPASTGESFVPFYGSYLDMMYRWERGEYVRSAGNFGLLITDFALAKSLFGGLVKASFKAGLKGGTKRFFGIGMSHEYGATVSRLSRLGINMTGYKHHWLITQKMMKSSPMLKMLGNQSWNLTTFSSQASHMRFAHGQTYFGKSIPLWRFLYPITSTPAGFKIGLFTTTADIYNISNN